MDVFQYILNNFLGSVVPAVRTIGKSAAGTSVGFTPLPIANVERTG
jgi:hypothetical protein